MAETEYHWPDGSQVVDGIPDPDDTDWRTVDRLIILLSLTITERFLRRRKTVMQGVRGKILARMRYLIGVYRTPRKT